LIAIRHAQSNFNKGFLSFKEVLNPNMRWKDCIQLPDFNREVSYAKQYIDCSITEQGKAQCTRAREELKTEEIDIVLVSPHRRALETCQEIFGGRNIRVEVHPIFAEVFRFSCDISSHI
jgi:broad specificity phosphatase PhoE